jgi:hypothetical protein
MEIELGGGGGGGRNFVVDEMNKRLRKNEKEKR